MGKMSDAGTPWLWRAWPKFKAWFSHIQNSRRPYGTCMSRKQQWQLIYGVKQDFQGQAQHSTEIPSSSSAPTIAAPCPQHPACRGAEVPAVMWSCQSIPAEFLWNKQVFKFSPWADLLLYFIYFYLAALKKGCKQGGKQFHASTLLPEGTPGSHQNPIIAGFQPDPKPGTASHERIKTWP